jgi:crotonobetaine/carnitine-CoA ligase
MPAGIWEDFRRRFGVEILEFYGAAEGGLTINPPGEGPVGSVGKPPPGMEVAVLDDEGNPCAPNVAGEICFRLPGGHAPPLTYEKNPDASARKTAGGWLHMGDVGHLDANGWLFFHYRTGGSLRRNGEFIEPRFVEAIIASCGQVSDAFVYGVARHEVPGEQDVVAAVVPVDPARFDGAAVFRHCRATLRPNLVPQYLQLVDEIPKTASQKPLERVLMQSFAVDAANVYAERGRRS